ncbi:hypothetical protein HDV06_002117 [Boothiomyces sp. JEL0866]|nr:hypothetical protein HDV06_002117 [Boothiomyces sp. JEL0866]
MSYGGEVTFFAAFIKNFEIPIPSYMLLFGLFYLRSGISEYITHAIYKRLSPYFLKERSLEYGKTCLSIISYELVEWILTPLDFYLMYSNLYGLGKFMGFVQSKGFRDLPQVLLELAMFKGVIFAGVGELGYWISKFQWNASMSKPEPGPLLLSKRLGNQLRNDKCTRAIQEGTKPGTSTFIVIFTP